MSIKHDYQSAKYKVGVVRNWLSYNMFDKGRKDKPIYLVLLVLVLSLIPVLRIWVLARYVVLAILIMYGLVKIVKIVKAEVHYHFKYVRDTKQEGFVYESRITDPPIRRK